MPSKKPKKPEFKCEYCKKKLASEKSLLVHVCDMKRRYLRKDDRPNRVGFMIFQKFWRLHWRTQRDRTYDDFAKSSLFAGLVSFGKYIGDINALRPEDFVDFILKSEVPLSKWESPLVYQRYVRELTKKETPMAAVERNFLLMQQWALDSQEEWTDFFRKIPTTLATQWIISGRISPWVLYIANSAIEMMKRFDEEQMRMIQTTIEPKFWAIKLKTYAKDVAIIQEQLDEVGL